MSGLSVVGTTVPAAVCSCPDALLGYMRQWEHDSRLIAAAPELLEALLRLANAADTVGVEFFDTDDMPESVEAMQAATLDARTAIALATTPQTRLDNGGEG